MDLRRTLVGSWIVLGQALDGPWTGFGQSLEGAWTDLERTLLGRTLTGPWMDGPWTALEKKGVHIHHETVFVPTPLLLYVFGIGNTQF